MGDIREEARHAWDEWDDAEREHELAMARELERDVKDTRRLPPHRQRRLPSSSARSGTGQ